jgi:hypothetical protein
VGSQDASPSKAIAESTNPTPPKPIQQAAPITIPTVTRDVRHRIVRPVELAPRQRKGLWIATAIGVLLLAFLLWHFLSPNAAQSSTATQPVTTLAASENKAVILSKGGAAAESKDPDAAASATTAPTLSASKPATPTAATTNPRDQWRVVAYTYNHQDQAQKKVATIAKRHPSLNPEVFTPNGHAPYLVTVGGPMSRDQAIAFKNRVRGEGLPRDLYAQNYTTRNR